MTTQKTQYFIGIDVGTGSARAGVFDRDGGLRGQAACPIRMWKPEADFVEQSSGAFPDLAAGMAALSHPGRTIDPNPRLKPYHDAKYRVFRRMHADFLVYRGVMNSPRG